MTNHITTLNLPYPMSDNKPTSEVPKAQAPEGIFRTLESWWNNISPTQPQYQNPTLGLSNITNKMNEENGANKTLLILEILGKKLNGEINGKKLTTPSEDGIILGSEKYAKIQEQLINLKPEEKLKIINNIKSKYEFFFKDGTTDYAFKNYEKNYRILEKNENRNNNKKPQDPKLLEQKFLYLVNKYATNSDFRALLDDPHSEHKLPELAFSLTISHLSVRQNQTPNNKWVMPQETQIPNNTYPNPHFTSNSTSQEYSQQHENIQQVLHPKHPTLELLPAQATIKSILNYMSGVFSWNKENTQEANGKKKSIPTSQHPSGPASSSSENSLRAPSGPKSPAENPAKTSSNLGSNRQITETEAEQAGRKWKEVFENAMIAAKKAREVKKIITDELALRENNSQREKNSQRKKMSRNSGINDIDQGGR